MEQSSSHKETIQHQYDTLIKKVLKGEARNYLTTLVNRASREVLFSEMTENESNSFFTTDIYATDFYNFEIAGYDVLVKNDLLGEALKNLPDKNRDIILMSYFLDMSDAEIGEVLNVVRSTVFKHRKSALAKIKKYMEGYSDDNGK